MVSTRLRAPLLLGAICLAWVALGAAQDPAPSGSENEKTLYANTQETFSPGFALGDVAVAEPEIADYKVLPGRREMLLYGKAPGTTTLTLWDQKRVQRAVITVTVISREDQQAEKDLKELVADFPSVKVRRVKGKLVLTGVVQTKNDLEAIEKIAETAEATSLVRLSGMVQPTSPGGPSTPSGPTDAPKYNESGDPVPPPATIHYEFDVLEASVNYSSGSYVTGVEPAGRILFKKVVAAGTGGNVEVYVPGSAILPPDKATTKPKKDAPIPPPIGIKLTLQPSELAEDGSFTTVVPDRDERTRGRRAGRIDHAPRTLGDSRRTTGSVRPGGRRVAGRADDRAAPVKARQGHRRRRRGRRPSRREQCAGRRLRRVGALLLQGKEDAAPRAVPPARREGGQEVTLLRWSISR